MKYTRSEVINLLHRIFDATHSWAINNKGLEVKNVTKSYDNKRILDNVREITDGQLSLAEAAQNTNIALSMSHDNR